MQIGQKLIIPGKNAAPAVEPEKVPDTTTTVPPVVDNNVVIEPAVPTAVTGTTAPSTAVTGTTEITTPTDGGDADSEIQMVTIEADTTAAELAVKYNVSAENISQKNSGKTEFLKGDIIFIPKN